MYMCTDKYVRKIGCCGLETVHMHILYFNILFMIGPAGLFKMNMGGNKFNNNC